MVKTGSDNEKMMPTKIASAANEKSTLSVLMALLWINDFHDFTPK